MGGNNGFVVGGEVGNDVYVLLMCKVGIRVFLVDR